MTDAKIFTSFFVVAAMAYAAPASARPDRSITIDHADLDLSRERDLRTLDRRIGRAVDRLCGATAMAKTGLQLQRINICAQQAKKNSAQQIVVAQNRHALKVVGLDASVIQP